MTAQKPTRPAAVLEAADKARQGAQMLVDDVRELHSAACTSDALLEILAFDLIAEAQHLADRLARVHHALRAED